MQQPRWRVSTPSARGVIVYAAPAKYDRQFSPAMAPTEPTRGFYPPLGIQVAREVGRVTVALVGELDLASVVIAQVALQRAAREANEVALDLGRTLVLDAAGVRFLISAQQRARTGGHRLIIRRPSRSLRRVLELTGALAVLNIEDNPGRDGGHQPPG